MAPMRRWGCTLAVCADGRLYGMLHVTLRADNMHMHRMQCISVALPLCSCKLHRCLQSSVLSGARPATCSSSFTYIAKLGPSDRWSSDLMPWTS